MKLYIDYSTLTLWRLCPQKFIFNSKLNLSSGNTEALNFGTLMHYGTELIGIAQKENKLVLADIDPEVIHQEIEALSDKQIPSVKHSDNALVQILNQVAEEASQYTIANLLSDERRSLKHALTLTAAYARQYTPETLRFKEFEQKFEIFLGTTKKGHEVYYRGTMDGLLEDGILERKTTYDLSAFLDLLSPNYQATGYVWAARELTGQTNLSKVVFDGISTKGYGKSPGAMSSVPARWTIYTKPEQLFLRATAKIEDRTIDLWKAQTLIDADRLLEDYVADAVTRNAPSACQAYNTKCSYKAICMSQNKNIEDSLIKNFTKPKEIWDGFAVVE